MGEFGIYPVKEPSKAVRALAEQIARDGGDADGGLPRAGRRANWRFLRPPAT